MTAPSASPVVFGWLTLSLSVATAVVSRAEEQAPKAESVTAFVGTYTDGTSRGIYRFEFDEATGEPGAARLAAVSKNPSFLALDPPGRFLYAVNEVDEIDGRREGAVSGFAVDPQSGDLTALNRESTGGAGPCYLVVDKVGKNVLVANYGGGSVAVLPIGPDGLLKTRSAFVQHTGSSVDPSRQKEPHAHSINLDPANACAFAADLGLDKVFVYRFDPAAGTLTPNDPPATPVRPGSGPRHFAFHPSGAFAYVINELNSTVTAWTYDPRRGVLSDLQTTSTLPQSLRRNLPNHPADVQVHRSGRFLYGSNRGHDSIVAYGIDAKSGKLTYIAHQSQNIKNPRNFGIDPTGGFLLVANQDLDTIVVFRIDPNTGALTLTGHSVKVPKPVCIKFQGIAG